MLLQLLHFHEVIDPLIHFLVGQVDTGEAVSQLAGLRKLATALDVVVIMGALPPGWWGAYHAPSRTVTMRHGLPRSVFRSVLAHELGHAHFGHAGDARHDSAQERKADRFAATHLIGMDRYAEARSLHGDDRDAVAEHLDVMPWVVDEYAKTPSGTLVDSLAKRPSNVVQITDHIHTGHLILGNNVLR